MMADHKEQVIPLDPAADRFRVDEESAVTSVHNRCPSSTKPHRRGFIICCGFCSAMTLLLAITFLVLALTVFRIREPDMMMNAITMVRMRYVPQPPSLNATLVADISVKNPNAASFRYRNGTAHISYRNQTIGEARIPAGKAPAQRTVRMNVTMDVSASQELLLEESVMRELLSGNVTMNSYTKLGGRVTLLNIFERHADVTMNCTITIAVRNQAILEQKCKKKIKL